MKHSLLIFFLFGLLGLGLLPVTGVAQTISGNIVDGLDRSYVEGVTVVNLSRGDSAQTNARGYFRLKGQSGDRIAWSKPNWIGQEMEVGEERHLLLEIYLNARTLPTFDVYGDYFKYNMDYEFQPMMRGLSDRPAGPGKIYSGLADNPGLMPGLTIDGPISYFMKSERYKRQYRRKMEFRARQQPYLDLIQSDSVRNRLILEFNLTEKEYDSLVVEFNWENRSHQFADLPASTVSRMLYEFFRSYAWRRQYDPPRRYR
ncbi:hypothetical protein A3SI_05002 [Nitritalea halalkaliphila LW7]|uniref:Uncharacterized protein n=1 Tax=Nitritalea halalkaliphila LW7 TaxID=1189621 RepID=I5C8G5_9BACT|nr:hypothetical protein [Nitritalea halalkaliphila]EIM78117.1 hypothetical protein A3SI_05002 [Nitritalea halalkaliphila LW7]